MTENRKFCAGLVQMQSGLEVKPNLEVASRLIREAVTRGAQYVQTPENTLIMDLSRERLSSTEIHEELDAARHELRGLAEELGIWLHIGASPARHNTGKLANRAELISPDGLIHASYDKIHMFDVDLGGGETYRESASYEPGKTARLASLPWGELGMTICYDLRFPGLYRGLAQSGADYFSIPAAFTRQTGEAHWHVLQRARAIENGCYVLSAAQAGMHEVGRETYGHSLIVSPWGQVIAEAEKLEPCVILADIDREEVERARARIPSLSHDRSYKLNPDEDDKNE